MAISFDVNSSHFEIRNNNSTTSNVHKYSGYDLPVYGMDNGQFLAIHIPALIFIFLSMASAATVIVASFIHQKISTFFTWTKSERFAVYIAICDGLFNVCHSMDHLHITVTKEHIKPPELCVFYGFMLVEMISAQILMVNIVSINAFMIVYFQKNLDFGKCDWKLLVWMFGLPCVGGLIAFLSDTLGPNGAFCYFDGIKGELANLFFTTIPLLIILFANTTLYILTWLRIRSEEPRFKNISGQEAKIIRASLRAARRMSLFVIAFFIQWWAMALYGVWHVIDHKVPMILFQFVTTFTNSGGILNAIVYFIIRKKEVMRHNLSMPRFRVREQSPSLRDRSKAKTLPADNGPLKRDST